MVNLEDIIIKDFEGYDTEFSNEKPKKDRKKSGFLRYLSQISLGAAGLGSYITNNKKSYNEEEYNGDLESVIKKEEIYSNYKKDYLEKNIFIKDYLKSDEYDIYNINLEKIIKPYAEKGYNIKEINYQLEGDDYEFDSRYSDILKQIKEIKKQAPVVETKAEVPEEYRNVMAILAKEHPDVRYAGHTTLEDKSQHQVKILTFEYTENGETKQIHIVDKDLDDDKEEVIPAFLNRLGIHTHSVYDRNTRMLIQHVGERELRDVVRNGSESDIRKASERALDKISQIHVLASQHLPELKDEFGLSLETTDYHAQFRSRFLQPVSGNSLIISPQRNRLMQAYSAFIESFDPRYFVHGDLHTGNIRDSADECFVIDFESAKIGRKFDDLSRFVNSVIRDRPDMDAAEYSREALMQYVDAHNQHSSENGAALLLPNERLQNAMRYSLINDELYKIGEYVLFGQAHPNVLDEKIEKSVKCFERAVSMIDGAIEVADKQRNFHDWDTLSNLRGAVVDYVAMSPIEDLRKAANQYKKKKESLVLVAA